MSRKRRRTATAGSADQPGGSAAGDAGGPPSGGPVLRPPSGSAGDARAQELELWDRVLKRWNEHIGRQVKIAATVVTFVIAIAGFLGIRSLDKMVEDSVRSGVEKAADNVQHRIERDTERLSDQLGDKLAKMTVEVARMETEAEKARALIARMDEFSQRFAEIDADLRGRIAEMEDYAKRFDGIEKDLGQRIASLKEELTQMEIKLGTSAETLQTVRKDVERVGEVAGIAAKAALKPVASARGIEGPPATANGRPAPPVPPATPDKYDALGIRQVPTRLGDQATTPFRQPMVLIIFSAAVDATVPEREAESLLAAVDKVTYSLDERWFTPNVFERASRQDNFQFSITVWGRTLVKARAEFRDRAAPLCWAGLMDLDKEILLDRAVCGTAESPPGGAR